jgi:hypothetical protein
MSDLQSFPVSLPGGINQSAPLPTEGDLEELLNFGIFRNRVGLRAPLQLVATLEDDQDPAEEVTSILDIVDHEGNLWVASHSTTTDKVYLHSMQVDGTSVTLEAVLWTSVVSRPTIILTSFEGGDAASGVSRLYAADYNQNLETVYWDGATVTTLTEDLDNDDTAEDLYFSLVIPYKFHLWGTGFFESAVLRPEMIRFTQPGAIPSDDDGGGVNPKEWHSADHRSVGRRGDKIVAVAIAGDRLIVFQKRATHAIYGSGATTWTRQELSNVVGCVGPHAVASVDERIAYFWASDGPYRTDGSQVMYIGDPIRQFAVEIDADEFETRVAYSPDDGLVYFVVSPGGQDSYHFVFVFDHRRERWMRSIWLDGSGGQVEYGAFTAMDSAAAPGPEAAPSTLVATAVSSQQVDLTWVNGDVNVNTETHIYRSESSGFTPNDATNMVTMVGAGTSSYSDTDPTLDPDTTYYYKLTHFRNSSHSAESNQDDATTWLAPPTAVGLAGLSTGLRITGTNPVTGGDVVIQRRNGGGSFTTVTTLSNPGGSFSYDDDALTCGTVYFYRTKTQLGGSTDSEWSETVSRTACDATTAPAAPSDLTVGSIDQDSIGMSWTDNSDNEDEFQILRSTDGGDNYFFRASLPPNTTSYTDEGLDSNTEYYYKVRSINSVAQSALTDPINATTAPGLTPPSDLTATAVSTSQINLSWTDTAEDETNWQVFRDDVFRAWVAANATSFQDTGLSENTSYTYKVRAVTGSVGGSFSNEDTAQTISGNAPTAPTSLTATVSGSSPTDTIDLAWTDNASDESEYQVWRSSGGSFSLIATIAANLEAYEDDTCADGTTYTYYVRACNGFGCTSSNQDSATTSGTPTVPAAPSSLVGVGDDRDVGGMEVDAVDLTWTDNSNNEEDFVLERRITGGSTWTVVATLPTDTTSFRDEGVQGGVTSSTSYDYRIKARNSVGDSSYSNTAVAIVEAQTTCSNLVGVDQSYCNNDVATPRVRLTWQQGATTDITRRLIYRQPVGGFGWTLIAEFTTNPSSVLSYDDDTVNFGTNYEYRVTDTYSESGGENQGVFPTPSSAGVTPIIPDCGGPE